MPVVFLIRRCRGYYDVAMIGKSSHSFSKMPRSLLTHSLNFSCDPAGMHCDTRVFGKLVEERLPKCHLHLQKVRAFVCDVDGDDDFILCNDDNHYKSLLWRLLVICIYNHFSLTFAMACSWIFPCSRSQPFGSCPFLCMFSPFMFSRYSQNHMMQFCTLTTCPCLL